MKKHNAILALLLSMLLLFTGCGSDTPVVENNTITQNEIIGSQTETSAKTPEEANTSIEIAEPVSSFDFGSIPKYNGNAYIAVNNNIPFFTDSEYTTSSFETYTALDSLGRCGVAFACVGTDIMPTEERGSIGSVKPTGWQTIRYENVDGKYLYNRCHLLGFQLTGENANTRNLITGTRYLNIQGMLPFENMVADYVQETNNHVLFRVSPIFEGDNLLASGVLMEGLSMEDNGDGICFNVYCYNVQPGIVIDYRDGSNYAADGSAPYGSSTVTTPKQPNSPSSTSTSVTYIGNKNTKKFHYPNCSSVKQMNENNKKYLTCTREEAISMGYDSCGRCTP